MKGVSEMSREYDYEGRPSRWGWFVLIVLILLVFAGAWCDKSSAAEPHAIVEFRDAEHLAALKDSLIGVCDTVGVMDTLMFFHSTAASPWHPDNWCLIRIDTIAIDTTYNVFYQRNCFTITCRELVTIAVVRPLKIAGLFSTSVESASKILHTPGQAIICWREVRR
jgi:hypothetical protein